MFTVRYLCLQWMISQIFIIYPRDLFIERVKKTRKDIGSFSLLIFVAFPACQLDFILQIQKKKERSSSVYNFGGFPKSRGFRKKKKKNLLENEFYLEGI